MAENSSESEQDLDTHEAHAAVASDESGEATATSELPGRDNGGGQSPFDSVSGEGSAGEDDGEDQAEFVEQEEAGEDDGGELEGVPGFDAGRVFDEEYEGGLFVPPPEDLEDFLQDPGAEEFDVPESVCGRDDRVRIRATTRVPWRWVCQLIITRRDGRRSRCTGWLIAPRTVMTAGHCLYSHAAGGWARRIEVIPGMDANHRPFGSQVGTSFRSVVGWTRDRNPNYDYGAIILPRQPCRFRALGNFGFASYSSSRLRGLLVNNSGYPGDKPFGTQWFNAGRITRVTSRRLFYLLDTFGGQSGSPVWALQKIGGRWQRIAVGIHGYGGCPNKSVRIIRPVFNNMMSWRQLGRC